MTQEDKDLLIKDLCCRLPYGVTGKAYDSDDELLRKVTIAYHYLKPNGMVMTGDIKPYLFPLSSMTEEQKDDYDKACEEDVKLLIETSNTVPITNVSVAPYHKVDWLNKNHFDYRGLIEKGLAIDATGLNIY